MLGKNTIAAIDLGSNSFHMVVAEEQEGQLVMLDRIREMVRLGEGVGKQGKLDPEVQQRALDCLSRFGQRLRGLEANCVSAVGTNTLRRISDSDDFIFQAEQALGFPIEVISGIEEARLVYQGVARTLEQDQQSKLIIDIGGGSTELIIGEGFTPRLMHSLEMGCVMMTQRFFYDGKIKEKRLAAARIFVLQRMKAIHYAYSRLGWKSVIGSSGSIKSIANVIREMKIQDNDGINQQSLTTLISYCSDFKKIKKLDLPGLSEKRLPVFMGGLIVLAGVFEALGIKHMHVSQGALREGLLNDMVGRRQNKDIRNESIAALSNRFNIDQLHAKRIEDTAFELFNQLKDKCFKLYPHAENLLRWASTLHEIGRNISLSSYQKHGAYIIEYAELAGFSRQEQCRLATIVGLHRGKFSDENYRKFSQLTAEQSKHDKRQSLRYMILLLTVILRLSTIFHRSRSENKLPEIGIKIEANKIILNLPDRWLNEHPLTINDLQHEADYLSIVDVELEMERML